MNTCKTCIYRSDGFGDELRGSAWCYSESAYVPDHHACDYWQATLRTESMAPSPMSPDQMLAAAVGVKDREVED